MIETNNGLYETYSVIEKLTKNQNRRLTFPKNVIKGLKCRRICSFEGPSKAEMLFSVNIVENQNRLRNYTKQIFHIQFKNMIFPKIGR
jgi:hypothetical protein